MAGYRLTGDARMRARGVKAATIMARRYNPAVGATLSRPNDDFNMIIESLMKSQLLWWAARNGGSPELAEIARQHALTIARDFIRPDGSTYHIVYYDAATGDVIKGGQSADCSEDSTWARGQAWAIWFSCGAQALDLRLARRCEVGAVRVSLYRGDTRAARLRIAVSADGRRWHRVKQTMTSGETSGYETLTFTSRTTRWVRISCSGTTLGPVNRIFEVEVYPAL